MIELKKITTGAEYSGKVLETHLDSCVCTYTAVLVIQPCTLTTYFSLCALGVTLASIPPLDQHSSVSDSLCECDRKVTHRKKTYKFLIHYNYSLHVYIYCQQSGTKHSIVF